MSFLIPNFSTKVRIFIFYIFPFCPSASALPSKYKNAIAGTRKIGTLVSCLAIPKFSNRFVIRKAFVTLDLSSLHKSTIASVAGICELLRYLTSQRIFSRGSSITTSTSFFACFSQIILYSNHPHITLRYIPTIGLWPLHQASHTHQAIYLPQCLLLQSYNLLYQP